jgi:hypothetical protein
MFQSVWSVIPKEVYFSKETIDSANAKMDAIRAQPPEKHFTDFDKTLPVRAQPVESDLDHAQRIR